MEAGVGEEAGVVDTGAGDETGVVDAGDETGVVDAGDETGDVDAGDETGDVNTGVVGAGDEVGVVVGDVDTGDEVGVVDAGAGGDPAFSVPATFSVPGSIAMLVPDGMDVPLPSIVVPPPLSDAKFGVPLVVPLFTSSSAELTVEPDW